MGRLWPAVRDKPVGGGANPATLTVSVTGPDALPEEFPSPWYWAVMECEAMLSEVVTHFAVAVPSRVIDPTGEPLSRNVTVPVGAPAV